MGEKDKRLGVVEEELFDGRDGAYMIIGVLLMRLRSRTCLSLMGTLKSALIKTREEGLRCLAR